LSVTVIVHIVVPVALFATLRCLYTWRCQPDYVVVPYDENTKGEPVQQIVPIGTAYSIVMPLILFLYSFFLRWQGYHAILAVLLITRVRSYINT
jgi:hypothetical protein